MKVQKLKDLSPQQCVKIASIVKPNINWKFVETEEAKFGFDLVDAESDEKFPKYIFQIDWRDDEEMLKTPLGIKPKSRFRLYRNLHECSINKELRKSVDDYLIVLNLDN